MKIGWAQTVITSSLGQTVFLAGFGSDRRAESVHDDLTARALCITEGQAALVLCAVDLIGLIRKDVQEVVERVRGGELFQSLRPEVLIASTHTHHGPDTLGLWGPDYNTPGVDEGWLEEAKRRIGDTLLAAMADLQECAEFRAASVRVPGVAKNARNPEIVDDELTLAQFLSPEGKVLASLFNFPCHPEVLWEHNPHITSDYPGYLREEVEAQTGAPCIFFAGGLGGMMTPDVKDHSFAEAEVMGKVLARVGLAALAADGGISQASPVPLSMRGQEIRAKLTNPLYQQAFARKLLIDVRDEAGLVCTEVNLIQIGGLWMATVPGELLPKLGLAIKTDLLRAGAQVAGVIGLANDELGYILPLEDFRFPHNPFKPGKHYEETNSIGRDIAPRVMEGVRGLLERI